MLFKKSTDPVYLIYLKVLKTGRGIFFGLTAISILAALLVFVSLSSKNELDSWETKVHRDGFVLLDKSATADAWFAVYDAGSSELAVCFKKVNQDAQWNGYSIEVVDDDGRDIHDYKRKASRDLSWRKSYGFIEKRGRDGLIVTIDENYQGPINLTFRISRADSSSGVVYGTRIIQFPSASVEK